MNAAVHIAKQLSPRRTVWCGQWAPFQATQVPIESTCPYCFAEWKQVTWKEVSRRVLQQLRAEAEAKQGRSMWAPR